MNNWVYGTIGIGIVLLLLSIFLFWKGTQQMMDYQKKGSYLLPNLSLSILSIAWIGLGIYLYLDIQNQINYFLN